MVGVKIAPNRDVKAIVAVKWGSYHNIAFYFTENLMQQTLLRLRIRRFTVIKLVAQISASGPFLNNFRIKVSIIQIPRLRFFPFCHKREYLLWGIIPL